MSAVAAIPRSIHWQPTSSPAKTPPPPVWSPSSPQRCHSSNLKRMRKLWELHKEFSYSMQKYSMGCNCCRQCLNIKAADSPSASCTLSTSCFPFYIRVQNEDTAKAIKCKSPKHNLPRKAILGSSPFCIFLNGKEGSKACFSP